MMVLSTITTQALADQCGKPDLFISACGYESRSTHLARVCSEGAHKKVAVGFSAQQELRYEENREWFVKNGFEVIDLSDLEFFPFACTLFDELNREGEISSVVIDVSCMNRARLAALLLALQRTNAHAINAAFGYNIAQFTPPSTELAPTTVAEPVTPEFAGWTESPAKPPAAIIGLGYEESRAIGIVDHLEINNAAWAFVPVGPIDEYSHSVDQANRSLFEMINIEGRKLPYDVMDPASLFRELNSMVDLLKQTYNPILVPFGPKIFALVALMVACAHRDVGVWRVSSGLLETPVDRLPSSHTTILHARYQNAVDSSRHEG